MRHTGKRSVLRGIAPRGVTRDPASPRGINFETGDPASTRGINSTTINWKTILLLLLLACTPAEPKKLNVLLITLDTFRADRVGALTPNLTRLAVEGVRFDQAQSPVPLTLPAHASILSGLLPLHHGLRNNGSGAFPADQETLATVLARGGYRTGAFVGAFVLDRRFGLARGFEVYDDEIARDPNAGLTLEAERRAAEVVDRAVTWLRGGDGRPAFAWVHLWDAHAPYAPPAPHAQTYDGEIAYVDSQLGRLLAAIDRTDTIVIVAGDHGESLGAHGEQTHGLLLYQPTIHIPMLITMPGIEARVVTEPVSSVDIAPTVASLVGLTMPSRDGRDLAEPLRSGEELPRADLYAETQYPLTFGWNELAAMRRGNLQLIQRIHSTQGSAPELYDLARDPAESANVLSVHRRPFRELASAIEALRVTATNATQTDVDDETKAKLASLGYVAPAPVAAGDVRADPRSMAPLFGELEQALADIARDEAPKAVPVLVDLVRRDPANPVFRATLARVRRQLGSAGDAVELYRQAVALAPRDADHWYNLGVALSECCDRKEAFAALSESARLDPLRAATHNAMGVLLIEGGEAQRAAEAFRRAVEADPRDARGWNNAGNALRALGRLREAEDAYRKAMTLAPAWADPFNGMGTILVQQQRAGEAISFFETAIRLQPDFYEAQLNRGIALQESGDRPGAAEQYRRLLAALPAGRAFDAQRDAARALLAGFGAP